MQTTDSSSLNGAAVPGRWIRILESVQVPDTVDQPHNLPFRRIAGAAYPHNLANSEPLDGRCGVEVAVTDEEAQRRQLPDKRLAIDALYRERDCRRPRLAGPRPVKGDAVDRQQAIPQEAKELLAAGMQGVECRRQPLPSRLSVGQ